MRKSRFRIHRRFALISCAVLTLSALLIVRMFSHLYGITKENILNKWQSNITQAADQINIYLKMPLDAVTFSAAVLNEMLEQGAVPEAALDYLKRETEVYASIISENSTGIYSYFDGTYLDGSGWVPPADYDPTARPWYTEALRGNGTPIISEPFLNLQTYTMMMSVCQLLDDKKSVVSMDIFLDTVQQKIEQIGKQPEVNVAAVINKNSVVLADANRDHVGKNMMEINARADVSPHISIFTETINDDWNLLFVLNDKVLFQSLKNIYLVSAVVLLLAAALIFSVFFYMSRKYEESRALANEVQAVANIYIAAAKISLKTGSIECIRTNSEFTALFGGDYSNFAERTEQFAKKLAAEQSFDILKRFMDTKTLPERLNHATSISQEILDDKGRWLRIRFIIVDYDKTGMIHHVLWALESIDEDRKQQEALRKLSETDMMTGITNRGTGEMRIRMALKEGKKGMFCLMDADKFKSINDTYGHQTGDEVICAIADCLKATFRDADIVFRLGGDEYAVFSIGVTDEAVGERIVERFFAHIDNIQIPALKDRKVTISVGASFYPKTDLAGKDGFETLYQRADEGLYKSKKLPSNALTFVH